MLASYYSFLWGILGTDTHLKRQAQVGVLTSASPAPPPTITPEQTLGDTLFRSTFWMSLAVLFVLLYFIRCEPTTSPDPALLLANVLPSAMHLVVGAALIHARMASRMVKYAVCSGTLLVIILAILESTWPQITEDQWIVWGLSILSALLYNLFLWCCRHIRVWPFRGAEPPDTTNGVA
jgi:hypothetical protein